MSVAATRVRRGKIVEEEDSERQLLHEEKTNPFSECPGSDIKNMSYE